jgi:hypothetical protein
LVKQAMGNIGRTIRNFFSRRVFVRSIYGETLVEDSLISAVASILAIRLFLTLTGYPQLGGAALHIAHMLWGGLFMFIAVFLLLGFLSRPVREFAAIIGGIGFGIFIDELGKFITRDNDYFFKPTVVLIYVIFVLIFLSIRLILRLRIISPEEAIANVIEIVQEASLTGLTPRDRELALRLLEVGGSDDRVTESLRSLIDRLNTAPREEMRFLMRLREIVANTYRKIVDDEWFVVAVTGFFTVSLVINLYRIITIIDWKWGIILWGLGGAFIILILLLSYRLPGKLGRIMLPTSIILVSGLIFWALMRSPGTNLNSFVNWVQFTFSSAYSLLIIMGISLIRYSRIRAFQMWRRATLLSIFLIRVFSFYQLQFLALSGLVIDILVLMALRYMINLEQERLGQNNIGNTNQVQ